MDYLIYHLADAHLQELADAALLSQEERAAAATRGGHYLLSRCLLRRELARRLNTAPQAIRFHYGKHGKPGCEGIHFNISHSGDCLAMVFDAAAPVGVDVERIRSRTRLDALAARIMCPEQLAAFRERGCPVDEFYTCWCAAEALVKQAGGSIWQARETPFTCQQGKLRLLREGERRLLPFSPMPGYAGVVAFRA